MNEEEIMSQKITLNAVRSYGYNTTKTGDIANNMAGEYTIQLINPLPKNINEDTHIFMVMPTVNNKNQNVCNNILAYKHIKEKYLDGLDDKENDQIKTLYDSAVKLQSTSASSGTTLLGGKRKTKQNKRKPRRRLQTRRYKKRV